MAGKDAHTTQLPPKENALFKSIVKLYTSKQYKKGLKAADQVLAKFPNHGETLAMKGLILNCQEKKAEAYDYVRRGLKNNLASHVCWHTYGLLYRSDRNYLEAIKCYRNALRHDKENMQILRDLSLLQVQMRDLEGYIETRRQILTLKPNQKAGWLAFSMAAHLMGSYKKALGILESYEHTLTDDGKTGFDYSETLLYKNMLLEEDGDLNGALAHLNQVESHIIDKQTLNEQRALLLHKLGKFEEAEKVIRALVSVNPDNMQFHHSLIAARLHIEPKSVMATLAASKPDDANIQSLVPLYEELSKEFPKCLAVRRLPLEFLHGDAFQHALERYIQRDLRRGVPSLFIGIKSLYNNQSKRKIIDQVFRSTFESLTTKGTFPSSEEKETPSTHLWGRYLYAQHLDRIGEYTQALEQVAQAVAHTPTVIELYVLRAKVLKHAGDIKGAWESYDKAREMDLADRYLNTKATLYALRADKIDTAEKTIALFTSKEGADSQETLFEMQCMWYETECGLSHLRQKKYGRALKKLLAVDKHFADITEDQFDFHMYCIRKMTLRTYVKMLRLEDQLYGHKFFQKAAQAAVRTYLAVFDTPVVKTSTKEDELAHLPEKERKAKLKRLKQKEEKEKARLAAEEEKREKEKAAAGGKQEKEKKVVDADPEGNALVSGDVLGEATKLLITLHKYEKKDITTNILAFKVYLRRKKYLLAVQSLRRAIALDAQHPEVYASILHLSHAISQIPNDSSSNETVLKVLRDEVASFLKSTTPSAFLASLVTSHATSFPHLIVTAQLTPLIQPENTRDALARLRTIPADACLRDAEAARDVLSAHGTPEDVAAFTQAAHARFPLANAFAPPAPPTQTTEDAQASNETDKN